MEDFYDSELAAEMVREYQQAEKHRTTPHEDVYILLKEADELEKQIRSVRSILLYRRRLRLEVKLMRKLLDVLLLLSPEEQILGQQVYDRLVKVVERVEKMC